jgi:hypothetical protein
VQLKFTGVNWGQATVKMYTADGRLLGTHLVNIQSTAQINLIALPAGTYLLQISGPGFELTRRFVKSKTC